MFVRSLPLSLRLSVSVSLVLSARVVRVTRSSLATAFAGVLHVVVVHRRGTWWSLTISAGTTTKRSDKIARSEKYRFRCKKITRLRWCKALDTGKCCPGGVGWAYDTPPTPLYNTSLCSISMVGLSLCQVLYRKKYRPYLYIYMPQRKLYSSLQRWIAFYMLRLIYV